MLNATGVCYLNQTEAVKDFLKVAYIPVFALGLLLNAAALFLFIRRRASWTDTHVYMVNLATADFALILFLPFRIYKIFNEEGKVPEYCMYLIAVHYLNMYASIFTVTGISVHRFVVIRFPFRARAWSARARKLTAFAVCVVLWVVVVTHCIRIADENQPKKLISCFERKSSLPLNDLLTMSLVGFLLPFCIILFCTSLTIITLLKDRAESTQEEKRISISIITANLIVFIVCYTPLHVLLIMKYATEAEKQNHVNCTQKNLVQNVLIVSEWLATTNCCLDSIGYYFLFRNTFC